MDLVDLCIDQFEISTSPGHPQAFKLLNLLLVKFHVPGIRLLPKCPTKWKDLCSDVPAASTREIGFCLFIHLIDSTVVLFTNNELIKLLFFSLTRQVLFH